MDSEADFCRDSAWQATVPSLVDNLADNWQKLAVSPCQRAPKKLTTEAVYVLCALLFVVMLSVIGSSINAFESFHKACLKKKTSRKLKDQKDGGNGETQTEGKKKSNISDWRGNWRKFFDCFCIQDNARKMFSDDSNEEFMPFVDGIRAMCFSLVFGCHFLVFGLATIKNWHTYFYNLVNSPAVHFSVITAFGMEAFIVLSGFLTAYCFSNYFEKNNGKIPWIAFYTQRILRLTPVYMAVLGFYITLFTYMSSSPVWPTYDTNPICKKTWILNFLYINNYDSIYNQCITLSWFLSCLMQLYVISPLFLVPLNRWPRVGYVLCAVTICLSCYLSFKVTEQHNLVGYIPLKFKDHQELIARSWQYVEELHMKTYTRFTPYLIGTLLGYHLHNRKLTKKNNWVVLSFGWILSILLICIAFFALYGREESVWESAIYNGVKSLLFSCGFSWLIFVCATGQGSFIGKFLSHRVFKPISRLSFCGYLTQVIVFEGYFLSNEILIGESIVVNGLLSDLTWMVILIRLLIWTLVLAFVASLLFEYPAKNLLKMKFTENKKRV